MADSDDARARRPAPQPPQTLGQMLRGARLAQDLTLEQLSTELRIEAKQLERARGEPVRAHRRARVRQGLSEAVRSEARSRRARFAGAVLQADDARRRAGSTEPHDQAARRAADHVVDSGRDRAADGDRGPRRMVVERRQFDAATGDRSAPPAAAATSAPPSLPPSRRHRRQQRVEAPPAEVRGLAPAVDAPSPATAAAGPSTLPGATPAVECRSRRRRRRRTRRACRGDSARVLVRAGELGRGYRFARRAPPVRARMLRAAASRCAASRRSQSCSAMPTAVRLSVDGEPYAIPTTGRQGDLARFAVDIAEE